MIEKSQSKANGFKKTQGDRAEEKKEREERNRPTLFELAPVNKQHRGLDVWEYRWSLENGSKEGEGEEEDKASYSQMDGRTPEEKKLQIYNITYPRLAACK